jgi:hypothetical protein
MQRLYPRMEAGYPLRTPLRGLCFSAPLRLCVAGGKILSKNLVWSIGWSCIRLLCWCFFLLQSCRCHGSRKTTLPTKINKYTSTPSSETIVCLLLFTVKSANNNRQMNGNCVPQTLCLWLETLSICLQVADRHCSPLTQFLVLVG